MRIRTTIGAAAALLAGVLVVPAASADRAAGYRPQVVVAVADTGINPYHRAFFRPRNTAHPCTWVKGFDDCSVPALRLSVGRKDYGAALAADRAAWAAVKPGQWYWIPRTNIIGAVCDPAVQDDVVSGPPVCLLENADAAFTPGAAREATRRSALWDLPDDNAHGTAIAASVVSEAPEALLLIHDGDAQASMLDTAPVTPDIQSHSWAAAAPVPSQAAAAAGPAVCPRALRRPETLFFLAAGANAPTPAFGGCEAGGTSLHVVGGSYPGYWNYDSGSAYDFASWHCREVATAETVQGEFPKCATLAAPTAAGAAAAALQRVREQDGYVGRSTPERVSRSVTRAQFDDALRTGASYAPEAKYASLAGGACDAPACLFGWAPLPPQAPWTVWGYGWLDSTVADAVASCALGRSCAAKPADAMTYNERRRAVRAAAGGA